MLPGEGKHVAEVAKKLVEHTFGRWTNHDCNVESLISGPISTPVKAVTLESDAFAGLW